jgi:hypothetical protein
LSNFGGDDLSISKIRVSGDFAQTNNCGKQLAPALTCTVNVTFTPTATGTRQGAVLIIDNGPNGQQKVALTGNGV